VIVGILFTLVDEATYVTFFREWALPIVLSCLLVTAGCSSVLDSGGNGNAHPTVSDDATLATVSAGTVPTDGDRYYPENDTVQASTTYGNTTPREYTSMPFEEYARFKCGSFARDETQSVLEESEVENHRTIQYDVGDGLVRVFSGESEPDVVRSALPDGVEVDIILFERNHTCRVPIEVEDGDPDPVNSLSI